jgi:very-short-patch-repair endonuclease
MRKRKRSISTQSSGKGTGGQKKIKKAKKEPPQKCPFTGRVRKLCTNDDCKICFNRSFASSHRACFWSPKNKLHPRLVSLNAHAKYLFGCETCGHEYSQRPNDITQYDCRCPFCAHRQLCDIPDCYLCFYNSFASCPRSNTWSVKNKLTPRQVFLNDNDKYLFNCEICKHEFLQSPERITQQNSGCLFCGHHELCDDEKCDFCFKNSFASSSRASSWSKKNKITARQVFSSSIGKYLFDCKICKHEYLQVLTRGCPFCGHQKLCNNPHCNFCFKNSFASSARAFSWSKKNKRTARQVFLSSKCRYLFDCDVCEHEFPQSPNNITQGNQWCPFCAHKQLCEDPNCDFCFKKSFASSHKASSWSTKNAVTPRQIFLNDCNKYLFVCDDCKHHYPQSPNCITQRNNGCPKCKNKTELKLFEWLTTTFPHMTIETQQKFEECRSQETKRKYPFDFAIPSLRLIIEQDGPHHWRQVSNWQSPDTRQLVDFYKMDFVLRRGWRMIRICQETVLHDAMDWQTVLKQLFTDIRTQVATWDIMYISKDEDTYTAFHRNYLRCTFKSII